jgi:hypothetical protein
LENLKGKFYERVLGVNGEFSVLDFADKNDSMAQ